MRQFQLKDKVVDQGDFLQLTLDLQLKEPGTSVGTGRTKTYNGRMDIRDPVIEYDETKVSEQEIERIANAHGFQKR